MAATGTVLLSAAALQRMELCKVFEDNSARVNALSYHASGGLLCSSSDDETIHLYNAVTGSSDKTIQVRKYGCDTLRFTHHDHTVITASRNAWDQTVRCLSLHDNKYLCYYRGHRGAVLDIAMHPTTDLFMTSSADNTARLWDVRGGSCQGLLRLPPSASPVVSFDPEGILFAVAYGGDSVKLYDVRTYDKGPFATFQVGGTDHTDDRTWSSIQFSPDGARMLLGTNTQDVVLMDAFNGDVLQCYEGRTNPSRAPIGAVFTPDGNSVVSGSEDGSVVLWHADTGEQIIKLSGHPGPVGCVAVNPVYAQIATSCECVGLWGLPPSS